MGLLSIQILNAISYSLLLALIASGLVIVFGILKLVNFAHGSFYMIGAYIGFLIYQITGSFILALILAPIVVAVIGIVFQKLISIKLKENDELKYILLTFGLALVIENAVNMIWGNDTHIVQPPEFLSGVIPIFGFDYPVYRIFVTLISLITCILIYLLISKTTFGIKIKASTEDGEMATALGINVKKTGMIVFGLGIGLAGFAGIMSAPYLSISPHMGMNIIIHLFIIIVIGGMGSLSGAIIASFILGFVEIIGGVFFPNLSIIFIYLVMFSILMVNKDGIAKFFKRELI
ncbi:branched-chain amino acid transport system permease protein [Neobacillus sp. B4I6]|jgi:branched-chain amino acid transport system permease protein|uniref:branched-chain amino acid ABC transporter permease n=1 Tax=Neobacillus sp. B4I6 TaxID=3373925 RepID=UPI003D19AB79